MRTKPILIAGGHDKHISFDTLGDEISERVKSLYLTGDTAEQIAAAVRHSVFYDPSRLPIHILPDLRSAVEEMCIRDSPRIYLVFTSYLTESKPSASGFDSERRSKGAGG